MKCICDEYDNWTGDGLAAKCNICNRQINTYKRNVENKIITISPQAKEPVITIHSGYRDLDRKDKLYILGTLQAWLESEIIKLGKEPKPIV